MKILENPKKFENFTRDFTNTVRASLDRILRDSSKPNIDQFLSLMTEVSKIKCPEVETLLENCLQKIGDFFTISLNQQNEALFYDWIELVHDNFKNHKKIR